MTTSWADAVAAEAENGVSTTAVTPNKAAYVPPHLRNRPPSLTDSHSPLPLQNDRPCVSRWGGAGSRGTGGGGGGGGRGWNNNNNNNHRGGNRTWDRRGREVNPFENGDDDGVVDPELAFNEQQNTGINFDAYEDIRVETSGDNVPPPVNAFADIDLGKELSANIKRCKYVKPTPVQRHTIPISLAGRDLMACAQTGSGKTAAFCFPIITAYEDIRVETSGDNVPHCLSACAYFVSDQGVVNAGEGSGFV